ncbi:hypothetical protein CaCOL14_012521 [Colletotrichum acutatum]
MRLTDTRLISDLATLFGSKKWPLCPRRHVPVGEELFKAVHGQPIPRHLG